MRWSAGLIVAAACAAAAFAGLSAPAGARGTRGSFGGFSRDGSHYLSGTDEICAPLAVEAGRASGMPSCRRATAREVAAAGFHRGGRAADLSARASGSTVEIRRRGSARPIIVWDAGAVVSRAGGVYAETSGAVVVVEYRSRVAGRPVRAVVGFALAGGAAAPSAHASGHSSARAGGRPSAAGTPPPSAAAPALTAAQKAAIGRALRRSKRLARRHHFARAIAAARAALAIDAGRPEAKFRLAVALAGAGRADAAIAALSGLAHSGRPKAPVWLVVARNHRAFAALRANPAFRKAVGIDPDPNRPRTAYERLVGPGGRWEQAGSPCQRPRVDLRLRTRPQRFSLTIRSRCSGQVDRNRFGGRWMWEGHAKLMLVFPNQGADDEELTCPISRCGDGSGEDCVTCRLAKQLDFTLRVVRRRRRESGAGVVRRHPR